jgi:hypothetical protein
MPLYSSASFSREQRRMVEILRVVIRLLKNEGGDR